MSGATPDAAVFTDAPATVLNSNQTSTVRDSNGAESGACGNLLGTPEEIASTPRAYRSVELAALKVDGTFVASQCTYDRILADVTAIRPGYIASDNSASLAGQSDFEFPLEPYGYMNGKQIRIFVDADTSASISAGTYTAWDCLNNYYGISDVFNALTATQPFVELVLKGLYNTDLLASRYKSLPGVIDAVARVVMTGTTPGIYADSKMYVARSADRYQYAFRFQSSPCVSGQVCDAYYCYQTDAPGTVTPLGSWSYAPDGPDAGQSDCVTLYNQLCRQYSPYCN